MIQQSVICAVSHNKYETIEKIFTQQDKPSRLYELDHYVVLHMLFPVIIKSNVWIQYTKVDGYPRAVVLDFFYFFFFSKIFKGRFCVTLLNSKHL